MEKFDQLLPTLVPKKHRRKIYRGKAPFKKWLVTWESGRYHFPRWPYTITVYCRPLSRDTMFQPSIYDKGGKEKSDEMELHCPSWPVTFFERSVSPPQLWKCNKPETCWGEGKNFCRLAWTVATVTHTRPLLGLERQ